MGAHKPLPESVTVARESPSLMVGWTSRAFGADGHLVQANKAIVLKALHSAHVALVVQNAGTVLGDAVLVHKTFVLGIRVDVEERKVASSSLVLVDVV
eukprot:5252964-Pyramimonas_sp.AAC.1